MLGIYNYVAKPLYGYKYEVLDKARELGILMKSGNDTLKGQDLFVSPQTYKENGYVPDFFHPNITEFYKFGLSLLD